MSPNVLERSAMPHPDMARVVAISAAISLNAAVLLLALRPLAPMLQRTPIKPPPVLRWIEAEPKVAPKPLPPVIMPKRPHPTPVTHTARPIPVPVPKPQVAPTPMATPQTQVVSPPMPTDIAPSVTPTTAPPGPIHADLAYVRAPAPTYPTAARRAHMQGTVMLRVLVDTQGRPQHVVIAQSSGYPLLDRTARLQVLRKWLFQPAQVNGQTTAAWALVPVVFNLH
ncbi:energy transducer TonB [Oleiagrimonas soli]|uniref:Protein TonB n=1 Tax=Oleiagrimonas soli TaxID=1543381 RepID=A0A099CYQ3_9GAMM|nr:energy transducer TonB [Oleiagrimonas soli]KGI78874.1 hypothetical protein LF63_0102810 [Oleiagrimonas soli]MBB6184323.1 protein TonB [Oleiagrimonas soli]